MIDIIDAVSTVAFFAVIAYAIWTLISAKVRMYKAAAKLMENGASIRIASSVALCGDRVSDVKIGGTE